jgi:folate-binding protein YgfZ
MTIMLSDIYKRDSVPVTELFGVEYPAYFFHPVVEYQALVNNAAVLDLTHWRVFRLSGKDRASFLNAMVTSDVGTLETGSGSHALITTIKGKIIAELFVFAREDNLLVFVPQGNADETYDILQKHIIMDDVVVDDISPQYGVIAIEGPKSEDILWRIFPTGPFPKDPFQSIEREFKDVKITLTKTSVTGEDGYHMMIPAQHIEQLRDYVVQSARGSDGLPVGGIVWNMRRIEKGMPWFGTDFTDEHLPDEVRLGGAISYTKGCFRGQETLARLHHRGHVNRMLVGVTPGDDNIPEVMRKLATEFDAVANNYDEADLREKAEPIAKALDLRGLFEPKTALYPGNDATEKAVGWVASVAFSPQLKKPLLMSHVRREVVEADQGVRINNAETLSFVDLPIGERTS